MIKNYLEKGIGSRLNSDYKRTFVTIFNNTYHRLFCCSRRIPRLSLNQQSLYELHIIMFVAQLYTIYICFKCYQSTFNEYGIISVSLFPM